MDNTNTSILSEGPFLSTVSTGLVIRLVFYALLSLSIVVSNALVIYVYWHVDAVRFEVGNAFIVNIAYADFLVGVMNIPGLAVMDYYHGRWKFGEKICKFILAVGYLDTFIPVVIIILLMAYRIMMMSRSAKTRRLIKKRHVIVLMAILWLLLFSFYLFVAFGFPVISGGNHVDYSTECFTLDYVYVPSFTIAMMIFEFLVPLIQVWSLGITLIIKIRKILRPSLNKNMTKFTTRSSSEMRGRKRNRKHIDNKRSETAIQGVNIRAQTENLQSKCFNLSQQVQEFEGATSGSIELPAFLCEARLPTPAPASPGVAIAAVYLKSVHSPPICQQETSFAEFTSYPKRSGQCQSCIISQAE